MTSLEQNHSGTRRPTDRRGGRPGIDTWLQLILGWLTLILVFSVVLRNGGNEPEMWNLLCLLTLVLFGGQVVLDFAYGLPGPARKALWIAPFYGAVLVWLVIQSAPGLAPDLAHPVWALAPEGAVPAISADPLGGGQVVMRLTCYAMVFWIFLRAAGAAGSGGLVFIQAIALFLTALAIYGLYAKLSGYNVLLNGDETANAVRASFVNRNTYATVAVLGVLANVTAYVRAVGGGDGQAGHLSLRDFIEAFFDGAWLFAFGALVGLVALAMTESRAGALAGLIGVAVLVWALRRGKVKFNLALLAVPAVLFVFVALFMTSGVTSRMEKVADDPRLPVYRLIVEGIADRPLLGHGAGAFPEIFRAYQALEFAGKEWTKAHSSYLENAFEFGLPAAALLYLGLGLIGLRLLRGVLTRRRNQSIPAFAFASFVAVAFHAGLDFSLQTPAVAALFAAILGIGWSQSFATRKPADKTRRAGRGVGRGSSAREVRVDDL